MPQLNRTVSGLLLREDFSAANGWTAGTGWSLVNDPSLVTWGALPTVLLSPRADGQPDYDGVREGQLYVEGSTWTLLYDAGDHSTGWREFIATSTDRGITWSRSYQSIGYGGWGATATGWLEKRGSTYYLHRVVSNNVLGSPDTGIPADPYQWDVWSSSTINGTYTLERTVPLTSGGMADTSMNPGSTVLDSATYYHFLEGRTNPASYSTLYATASAPAGPWAVQSTVLTTSSDWIGPRAPENPKVFWHSALSRWVGLVNLIHPSGVYTDTNGVVVSTSLTDWSSATKMIIQRCASPLDDTNNRAVGILTHVTGPDGALVCESGFVPFVYDAYPLRNAPGGGETLPWTLGRSIVGAVMEPSAYKLSYDGTTSANRYYKTLSHTDFTAEFSVEFVAPFATGAYMAFEFRTNGTTGYRLRIRADNSAPRLLLERMDGTLIENDTTGACVTGTQFYQRIKIKVVGSQIDAYIDGEHTISVSDSTYASGTQVAFAATKVVSGVRLFHVRTGDTLTVRGLTPSASVWLRSHGQLPVAQITADGSGVATYSGTHFPLSRVEYSSGSDAQADDFLLWGGDDVTYDAIGHRGASGSSGLPVFGT